MFNEEIPYFFAVVSLKLKDDLILLLNQSPVAAEFL
jgi:hypothetical protein